MKYGKRRRLGNGVVVALLLLTAAGASTETPLNVFVSIPPQAWLARQIGGDRIAVETLLQPGRDPHSYNATPRQAMALGRADLYFTIGLPFERTVSEKLHAGTGVKVVATDSGIEKRAVESAMHGHHHDHDHQHHGHDHAEHADPHIWLSPDLLIKQAETMRDALAAVDPDHADAYRTRFRDLRTRLRETDGRIREMLAPCRGAAFYVFHPSFGYFADAYGLEQRAIEVGSKNPTPKQLRQLIHQALEQGVRVLFVQPQFDQSSARAVAQAINGEVLPLDPLAEDVIGNLETMARRIRQTCGEQGSV